MGGGIEVEVLTEGVESAGRWRACKKNPGHKNFIQASKFTIDHLPEPYKTKIYYRGIRALSRLTAKLTVKATSMNRPDDDCAARIRGTRFPRTGSGLIHEFWIEKQFSNIESPDHLLGEEKDDEGGYEYLNIDSVREHPVRTYPGIKLDMSKFENINVGQCVEIIRSLRAELDDDYLDLEWSPIEDETFTDDVWEEDDDMNPGDSRVKPGILWLRGNATFKEDIKLHNAGGYYYDPYQDEDNDYDDSDGYSDEDDYYGESSGYKMVQPKSSKQPKFRIPDSDEEGDEYFNKTYSFVRPCPCPECAESIPKPEGYYVNVLTARHVVFDDDEAKATVVELFYDDETAADVKKMYGVQMFTFSLSGDWCMLMCVTHERELVNKLQITMKPMLKLIDRMKNRSSHPLAVICSHPHGYVKQITLGEWVVRKVSRGPGDKGTGTSYLYETPTCPGSSGAAVLILGHRKGTRFLDSDFHPHHGSHISGSLNMSGRFFSDDREFKDAPSCLVEDLLHEYDEVYEKSQQTKAERGKASEGTEKFQFYIQYLRQKVADRREKLAFFEKKRERERQAEGGRKKQ